MPFEAIWRELGDTLEVFLALVPGDTLTEKTGLLANLFGIAGFVLSVGILFVRFAYHHGKRRPATQGDLDRLGHAVVEALQSRIVDQLVEKETERLQAASWLSTEQKEAGIRQMRLGLQSAVGDIANDRSDAGQSAAAALLVGDTQLALNYFDDLASSEAAEEPKSKQRAADALHMKAALQSLSEPERAIDACLRAVTLNPGDPLGWSRLGHLYLRLGKLTEARSAFDRAVAA